MIYCVVPAELADELLEKLTAYYAEDENVTVIVDRRRGDRRARGSRAEGDHVRTIRDRRKRSALDRVPAIPAERVDEVG